MTALVQRISFKELLTAGLALVTVWVLLTLWFSL